MVWINTHGEFIVGVLMILCIAFKEFLNELKQSKTIKIKNLILNKNYLLFFCYIVSLMINPHGMWGLFYPINAQTHPSNDWKTPFFIGGDTGNIDPKSIVLFLLLIIISLMYLYSKFKVKYNHGLLNISTVQS
jgi:hypothetical protein